MKLTIKHLAPYLPYGLKCYVDEYGIELIIGATNDEVITTEDSSAIDSIKPILRPLSEYKNCDEVMDEMSEYSEELFRDSFLVIITPLNKFDHINVSVYNALLKNHFDVFGLIEKGLAIDATK